MGFAFVFNVTGPTAMFANYAFNCFLRMFRFPLQLI